MLYELSNVIYDISMALLTSIIVYIFVEYIPERKNNIKAYNISKTSLYKIYSHMSRIIYMFLYHLKIEKKENDISKNDLANINELIVKNEKIDAKICNYIDGKKSDSVSYSYNLKKDSIENSNAIKKEIGIIKSNACSAFLSSDLLYILSEIENSAFLSTISFDKFEQKELPGVKYLTINFDNYFYDFIKYHLFFNCFDFKKETFVFSNVSKEELDKYNEFLTFCFNRGSLPFISLKDIKTKINTICNYVPNKERIEKGISFLIESLFCYDSGLITDISFLDDLCRLALYLETNCYEEYKSITRINKMQVLKRIRPLNENEKQIIVDIVNCDDNTVTKLCCFILLEDYENADLMFNNENEKTRTEVIGWPIYRLWDNPPIPANLYPNVFNY